MSNSTFVRCSDIACELGVTEETIYRWVRDGKFPKPLRLGLRKYVWLRKSVEVYFDERQLEAAEANEDKNL